MNVIGVAMKPSMRTLSCLALAFMAMPPISSAEITWTAGAPGGTSGRSLSFSGTGDGTGNGQDNLLTGIAGPGFLDGSYTVSAWLNADDVSTQQYAIGTTSQSLHLGLNGGVPFQGHWGNDLTGVTDVAIADGQWFHATFTYDSATNEQTIFINGAENATTNTNGAPNNTNQIVIGSRSNGGGDNGGNRERWAGDIDDVAFFSSVLSDTDILALASNSTDALALGASAYYNFEDDPLGSTAAVQVADGATSIGANLTGITPVPEPSSFALILCLGIAVASISRKRN